MKPCPIASSLRSAWFLLALFLIACAAPQVEEASVKPGINADYLSPELDVDAMVKRFEVESREIYVSRAAIAAAVGLKPGQRVADVGAGTGLFMEPFAAAVGPKGRVYCLEIAPPFVAHLAERAQSLGLNHVEARLCGERSVDLPTASIDVAFLCDVYHHFEYPRSSMESLRRALKPGGKLVLIDFERIPGVTREWLLNHVRAGRPEVIAELTSFGFRLVDTPSIEGLSENYCLVLERS
jgi:ubiquinone/menaquinone biosynthesis C-methylase UbiE